MSLDGRTSFVKVNIPFDVACLYDEKLQIKVGCSPRPRHTTHFTTFRISIVHNAFFYLFITSTPLNVDNGYWVGCVT